jgi:SAM-dependent methyltransferase
MDAGMKTAQTLLQECMIEKTQEFYDLSSAHYTNVRGDTLSEFDAAMWTKLNTLFKKVYRNRHKRQLVPLLVDLGCGSGRDIRYAQNVLNYRAIGVDFCNSFCQIIKNKKGIKHGSFVVGDIRYLMFRDGTVDMVRQNASVCHLPLGGDPCMVHLSLNECHRILRKNGILYILVKEGDGIDEIDTQEGFGKRIFQLFTKAQLTQVLNDCNFRILSKEVYAENRGELLVQWLAFFAQKR